MLLTRFLHLQIWDVYNEYVQYDNKIDTNWGITSGSIKLDKILMSEQLNYGEINASKLELQVFGLDVDLSNRKIKLEAIDAVVEDDYLVDDSQNYIVTDALDFITVGTLDPEHVFPLFCGYIESADKDYMSTDRNIEAYDWFYYHRNDNIAEWWNEWWEENSPYSPTTQVSIMVYQFLDDLLDEMGLTTSATLMSLPGGMWEITNPFVYVSTTGQMTSVEYYVSELKFGDILSMLGSQCGWTPIIDNDFTNVDFIWLDNGATYNLEGNIEKEECEWEDFETDKVTGVSIYDSSSSLAQSYGDTDNMYKVVGNVFLLSMSAQELSTRAQSIYNMVKDIQYTPAKIKCIVSDLYHKLGDKVVTAKGTSYILNMSLSGVLLVDEEINCPSKNGRTLDTTVTDVNDSIIEGAKSAVFEKDIDHMMVEYSDKIAGLSTRITQNTQAITAEVQRAQADLDDFMATTAGNESRIEQKADSVTTTVTGIVKREVKFITLANSYATITDGRVFTVGTAITDLEDGKRYSLLIQNTDWDTTSNKYIKINNDTTTLQTNTFPIYYKGDEKLSSQLGQGNTLNIRFYNNYSYAPSGSKKAFVVETSDRQYDRMESELNIERGRIVLRSDGNGNIVEARLDATGTTSIFTITAGMIHMTADEAMEFLSGGTLTLAGADGVVIDSPNFKVRRDGSVEVTGDITASSLTLVEGGNVEGFADIALSGSYDDLDDTPDLDIIDEDGNISGGTYAQGQTGVRISKAGLLQASNAVIYGTIHASAGSFTGTVVANSLKFNSTLQSINPYHNNETYNLVTHFGDAESYGSRINTERGYEAIRLIGYDGGDFNGYTGILKGKWWLENAFVSDLTKNGTWGDSNRASLDTALMNTLYASYGIGTATVNNAWCFGFITSSNTQLSVMIPISLRYSIASVTYSNVTISLRTAKGGYVISSGASISATGSIQRGQNMLYLVSTKTGKWYDDSGNLIPNNSIVAGQISFTATFA